MLNQDKSTDHAVRNAGSEARQAVDNTAHTLKDGVDRAVTNLRQTANETGEKIRDVVEKTAEETVHAGKAVTGYVRGNPIESSLLALGLGVIIGAVMRR